MGKKGNIVILEGPDNLPTSIARVKAYKDVLKEFPGVKLLVSKSRRERLSSAAMAATACPADSEQVDGTGNRGLV
jgi:ABC-type sugar transport system substrate-binding protein